MSTRMLGDLPMLYSLIEYSCKAQSSHVSTHEPQNALDCYRARIFGAISPVPRRDKSKERQTIDYSDYLMNAIDFSDGRTGHLSFSEARRCLVCDIEQLEATP
jgi:hypothetical protein